MDKFDKTLEFVLRWEGGYSNDSRDAGGETNFGIAKRSHPDVDIKNLTQEAAKAIYREEYWNLIEGDSLDPAVALATMDYAVNSGVGRASRALQRVVGAKIDGSIGSVTLGLLKDEVEHKGGSVVAQAVVMERVALLSRLVKAKPSMLVFLYGWMRRTHHCMAEVSKP